MATSKGGPAVRAFMAQAPGVLAERILPGAARAGAAVVAEEAKLRVISSEVRDAIKVTVKRDGTLVIAKVQVKGEGAYIAPWLEYGTAPHIISVADDRDRQGMSIGRINKLQKAGTLVIGGKPVGPIVHHPGARPHPFLRVSLDTKETEAIAAAQGYVNTRVARMRKGGLITGGDADE